jgi:hypothetical protein
MGALSRLFRLVATRKVQIMHKVTGGCHCGNIIAEVELTAAPDICHPRACDCDFCRKHSAAYLSDPKGSLVIQIKNAAEVATYRQGNGLAEFILCRTCGVLVAVLLRSDVRIHGAVNVRAFEPGVTFADERTVSPKKLSGDEKLKRWQDVWFANVEMRGMPSQPPGD